MGLTVIRTPKAQAGSCTYQLGRPTDPSPEAGGPGQEVAGQGLFLVPSRGDVSAPVCVLILFSDKDTSHIGLGPTWASRTSRGHGAACCQGHLGRN